jgi:uncharacterized protein (DUF4415 family)
MRTSKRRLDNQIKALLRLPDEKIDTSDIPEVTDWSKAVVGKFYRPLKEPVTIRLDATPRSRLPNSHQLPSARCPPPPR